MTVKLKTCTKCKEARPVTEYTKMKGGKDGLRSYCRTCSSARGMAWAKANPDKKRAALRKWYNTHHKSDRVERRRAAYLEALSRGVKACARCLIEKTLDQFGKDRRQHDGLNKYCRECHRHIQVQWRLDNPDKQKEIGQRYHKKHGAKKLTRWNRWARKRRTVDGAYRMIRAFRTQFCTIINSKKAGRRMFAMLGYTKEELRSHLEQQFEADISWNNFGSVWQVDHIRPIASFSFQNDSDIRACWALSNLRPLLARDNLTKNSIWNGSQWHRGKPRTSRITPL